MAHSERRTGAEMEPDGSGGGEAVGVSVSGCGSRGEEDLLAAWFIKSC